MIRLTCASCLLALFVFTAAGAAIAADPPAQPPPPDNLVNVRQDEQCRAVGTVFYRLAEQRRVGTGEAAAARRVAEWASTINQTGSHYIKNNVAQVTEAARVVYRLKQLNSISLGAFGRDSCRLQFEFEDDENKKTYGMYELVKAASVCQTRFPGNDLNSGLSECVRHAENGIADKLRTARVDIR